MPRPSSRYCCNSLASVLPIRYVALLGPRQWIGLIGVPICDLIRRRNELGNEPLSSTQNCDCILTVFGQLGDDLDGLLAMP